MTATSLNFALLDANRPEVARLIAAMVQARDAVEHRSWSHPQEPSGEEWWADVLAALALASAGGAPISPSSEHTISLPTKSARSYLSRAANVNGEPRLTATNSSPLMVRTMLCPTCSTISPHRIAVGSALNGIAAACTTSSLSKRIRAVSSQPREPKGPWSGRPTAMLPRARLPWQRLPRAGGGSKGTAGAPTSSLHASLGLARPRPLPWHSGGVLVCRRLSIRKQRIILEAEIVADILERPAFHECCNT
jgi:hypothetical protein